MAYKDGISNRTKNEIELVNNKAGKDGVYKIDVVQIEPVLNKTKTSFEYILYDKDKNRIGKKDSENKLTIFPEYNAKMKEKGIDLNSRKLVVKGADIPKPKKDKEKKDEEVKRQQEQMEAERERKQPEKIKKVKTRKKEDENIKSSSSKINRLDLMNHPKFKNVTAWTTITDNKFLDSVQGIKAHSPQLDKNSIVIAEINNEFKILAKEMGTNRIVDLTPDARLINNSAEQVNRIDDNKQKEGGRSYTFKHPVFDNEEIGIRKTSTGQIEVEQIKDIDGKGNREAIKIGTDVTHPTKEESERAKYEKYGYEFSKNSKEAVMTDDEIEEAVEPMILENSTKYKDEKEVEEIKTEIMDDVNSGKNPTYNDLEEIVDNNVEEYEKTEEEDELETEENENKNEERTLESDALDRINRRKKNT